TGQRLLIDFHQLIAGSNNCHTRLPGNQDIGLADTGQEPEVSETDLPSCCKNLVTLSRFNSAAKQPFTLPRGIQNTYRWLGKAFGLCHHDPRVPTMWQRGAGHDLATLPAFNNNLGAKTRPRFADHSEDSRHFCEIFKMHSETVANRFVETGRVGIAED